MKLLIAAIIYLTFLAIFYLPVFSKRVAELKKNGTDHENAFKISHNELSFWGWFSAILSAILSLTISYLLFK